MSLWVKVHTNFYTHRKTVRLRLVLGNDAYWIPPRLWAYAAENQPDGNFSDYSDGELAMLLGYSGDATSMLQALLQAGFLDVDRKIHNWELRNSYHDSYAERARKAARVRWKNSPGTPSEDKEENEKRREEQACMEHASSIASSITRSVSEQKRTPIGIPATEKEAIEWASMEAVPAPFAQDAYHQCNGRDWKDGAGQTITNWRSYVKSRFSRQQKAPSETGNGSSKPLTEWQINQRIKAKEERIASLRREYAREDDGQFLWPKSAALQKQECITLEGELSQLKTKLASMTV